MSNRGTIGHKVQEGSLLRVDEWYVMIKVSIKKEVNVKNIVNKVIYIFLYPNQISDRQLYWRSVVENEWFLVCRPIFSLLRRLTINF